MEHFMIQKVQESLVLCSWKVPIINLQLIFPQNCGHIRFLKHTKKLWSILNLASKFWTVFFIYTTLTAYICDSVTHIQQTCFLHLLKKAVHLFYFLLWNIQNQIGLRGEVLGLFTGSSSEWIMQPTLPKNQPLVWYKVCLWFTLLHQRINSWINGVWSLSLI